jgi:hypothetical protein
MKSFPSTDSCSAHETSPDVSSSREARNWSKIPESRYHKRILNVSAMGPAGVDSYEPSYTPGSNHEIVPCFTPTIYNISKIENMARSQSLYVLKSTSGDSAWTCLLALTRQRARSWHGSFKRCIRLCTHLRDLNGVQGRARGTPCMRIRLPLSVETPLGLAIG